MFQVYRQGRCTWNEGGETINPQTTSLSELSCSSTFLLYCISLSCLRKKRNSGSNFPNHLNKKPCWASKLFERMPCFPSKLFKRMHCFASKLFHKKPCFASKLLEQLPCFESKLFHKKPCFTSKLLEQLPCFASKLFGKCLASHPNNLLKSLAWHPNCKKKCLASHPIFFFAALPFVRGNRHETLIPSICFILWM